MKKDKSFTAINIILQTLSFWLYTIPAYAKIEVTESGEDMTKSIGIAAGFFLWGITIAGIFSIIAGTYKIVIGMSEDHNAKDVNLGLKMIIGGAAGVSIIWVLKGIGILV